MMNHHRRESERRRETRVEPKQREEEKERRDDERFCVDREKPVAAVRGRIRRRCGCRRLSEELSHVEKKVLEYSEGEYRERGKNNATRRDENAKRKHGKMEDALEAETTELDGNERVRGPHRKRGSESKGALKAPKLKCVDRERVRESRGEVGFKIIDEFKKSEKLFVDHEVVSSINLSNRAFGSLNAERAILTLSGDEEQLKMLGLDGEKMNGFRELGRKRVRKRARSWNGPVEENRNSERWEEEDEDAGDAGVVTTLDGQ